jgi:hypothetical protein
LTHPNGNSLCVGLCWLNLPFIRDAKRPGALPAREAKGQRTGERGRHHTQGHPGAAKVALILRRCEGLWVDAGAETIWRI